MCGLVLTQLRMAGFAAGLLAGAVGAFGYSLACPKASGAFVSVWYTPGIVPAEVLGAALGPQDLRWPGSLRAERPPKDCQVPHDDLRQRSER